MSFDGQISRRRLLLSLPMLAMAPKVWAQATARPPISIRYFNHFMFSVSDVQRSIDFYQGLFGMPIQARQGSAVLLRVGPGPQYLGLTPAGSNPPKISHFGLAVDGFNADRVMQALADHGVTKAAPGDPGLAGGPMKVRMTMRGSTPEIFVGDPDGLVMQLQDPSYCGGSGALGAVCQAVEPSPKKGVMAVKDMSHATVGIGNVQKTNDFYLGLFGLKIQGHQAPPGSDVSPFYGLGRGPQFLMFTGGGPARGAAPAGGAAAPGGGGAGGGRGAGAAGGAAAGGAGRGPATPRGPEINHICMSMDGFNPDNVTKMLNDYGIKTAAAGGGGQAAPLVTYISLRMPARGGSDGGTPELYFRDPDGLLLQLQDTTYCGGSGLLGETCTG